MTAAARDHESGPRRSSKGHVYCLDCFAQMPDDARRCPVCGRSVSEMSGRAYGEKLLRALEHPLAEVRMRAILALGMRGESHAAGALVACALRRPTDVIESLETVRSLGRLNAGRPCRTALRQLAKLHPANSVKTAAAQALTHALEQHAREYFESGPGDRHSGHERK